MEVLITRVIERSNYNQVREKIKLYSF